MARYGRLGRFGALNPGASRLRIPGSASGAVLSPFEITRATRTSGTEEQLVRRTTPALGQIMPNTGGGNVTQLQPGAFSNPPAVPVRDELKYSNFTILPLNISAASVRVLLKPAAGSRRVYLMIVNTMAAGNYFVAFGQDATLLSGVPILPNFGAYELNNVIPQDDIYIIASAANVTGVLVYSNDTVIGVTQ